jgi:hypothetical protein
MTEKPSRELIRVERQVARAVERLGQKREALIKSLREVEQELETLRPVAAAVFGNAGLIARLTPPLH